MQKESYSGRYFRTSYQDIKSSQGWFGKVCLLGLISFIPVFGQMTVYGYTFEWAHKAAWGVDSPMPKKIYGRPGSKMLRWGWFAFVISLAFALIPSILFSIANALSAAGADTSVFVGSGRYVMVDPGNPLLGGLGWIIYVAGIVLAVFACLLSWAGIMRMTMYDRLGTGFQIGKLWEMVRYDFGGIMRVFGMVVLFEVVGGIIYIVLLLGAFAVMFGATLAPFMYMAQSGMYSDAMVMSYIFSMLAAILPIFLILTYVMFAYSSFVQLLQARALGYWTRQFDVAAWGTKDDPLPLDVAGTQTTAQPQPPHAPVAGACDAAAHAQGEATPAAPNPEDRVEMPGDVVVASSDDADDLAHHSEQAEQAEEPLATSEGMADDIPPELNPVDVAEALEAEPDLPAAEDVDSSGASQSDEK